MHRFEAKTLAQRLLEAISQHDEARLRSVIEQGAHPDGWYEGGGPSKEIPLHRAAEVGAIDCIEALLEAGADINKRDYMGDTALFRTKSPEVVRALIKAGIDLHAANGSGEDALQYRLASVGSDDSPSVVDSETSVWRALLEGGLPLEFRRWGSSRLYWTAFSQNLPGVRFLLEAGHPIDADDGNGALHAICWQADYGNDRSENTREVVRTLLDAGFDPNARGDGGDTPMHDALCGDGSNLIAAEELLAAGADINATDDDGRTPLHLYYEALFDYERVVPFMLERGANPLIRDKRGRTVIDVARRMIAGKNPEWRLEMFKGKGGPPCGWKNPATPGDVEFRMLELLERAAQRFTK